MHAIAPCVQDRATRALCAVRRVRLPAGAARRVCAWVVRRVSAPRACQMRTVKSPEAVAIDRPSGLKATSETQLSCP